MRLPRRSPSNYGRKKARCGRAGDSSSAYGRLRSPRWPLRISTFVQANNQDLWRPHDITAPTGAGAAIFAITLACALLNLYGARRFRSGVALDWEVAGWTSVLGTLLVIGLQIWQLTDLPFFPGSSGYASCFIGWAALNIALLLSGAYWIETLLARHARLRRALREDGGTAQSTLPAARMFRASLEGCAYYWGFIGMVATLFWVLFYVL